MKIGILIISFLICTLKDFSQPVSVQENFYENGKISARGFVIQKNTFNSRDTGLWTRWYENGQKLSEEFRNDPFMKKYINCWTNTGQQICTNGNGRFLEEGADIGWGDNSTLFTIKDSIRQGPFEVYTPYKKRNVKTGEGNFINGLIQGEMKYFYETGQLSTIQIYRDNKESGWRKEFQKNRKLKGEGKWRFGDKDSVWAYYDFLGNLEKKVTYEKGKEKHEVDFYATGDKKAEGDLVYVHQKPIVKKQFLRNEYTEVKTTILVPVKNGLWMYYSNTGVPSKKETYVNGELLKQ